MLILFILTAASFVLGALASLRHSRWVRRLPSVSEFTRTDEASSPPSNTRCSIVVAARNEQARIEHTVRRLLAQTQVEVELIVVNDRSTDRTREILDQLAKEDSRLKLIHISALPDGWLGKCHACHLGANAATGEWILFTDADCWLKPDVLVRAIRLAARECVDHVTLTSGIGVRSLGLRACHLMFLVSLASWISGVNRDRPKAHLGIGAFNLVRASAYRECGGYEALRLTVLDDVKLGLLLRRAGKRTRAFLGADDVEAYWGEGVSSIIKIMEKNYFAAVDFNVFLAFGVCAFLTLLLCTAAFGIISWTPAGITAGLSPLCLIAPGAIFAKRIGWSRWVALGVPFVLLVFVCALLNSTLATLRQGGIRWRETFYPLDTLRAGRVRWPKPAKAKKPEVLVSDSPTGSA